MSHIKLIATLAALSGSLFAGTYTASSCNRDDVNAVINGPTHTAVDGDVIQIPAGSCTWTSNVTAPSGVGITIKGSGIPDNTPDTFGASSSCTATIITDNVSGNTLFSLRPAITSSLSRISCMKVRSDNAAVVRAPFSIGGACNSATCSNFRLDNITIDPSFGSQTLDSSGEVIVDNVFGVLDHNSMSRPDFTKAIIFVHYNYTSWEGVGLYGDNSRSSPSTFGTQKTLYVENNNFGTAVLGSETEADVPYGGRGGGRIAIRFNQMNGTWVGLSNHGTESNGRPRGPLQGEFYGNNFNCTAPSATASCQLVGGRSGTYMVFGNTATGGSDSYYNSYVDLPVFRTFMNTAPWLLCDGTGPYDNNSVSPPICIDQPTRSGGALLSGTTPTPTGWVDEFIEPTYEWNNTGKAPGWSNVRSTDAQIVENRDYYSDNSFGSPTPLTTPGTTLSTGVKFGTKANRPTQCTVGVAYWATNEGTWNHSGNSFGQGNLYKCTGTDTWTLFYTPYTYPHPLVGISSRHTGGRHTGGRQ